MTETRSSAESQNEIKIEKLTGKTNYLGWSKVVMAELKQRGYWDREAFSKATSEKASALLLKHVSLKIAGMLPDDEGPLVMWNWLKSEYGPHDLYEIKRTLKNVKMIGIDLDAFWETFHVALANFKAAGGKMDYSDQLDLVLENIHPALA